MGADYIEIDVQRSKDGKLVILHDTTVDRTTDGTGKVGDLDFKELRQLDAGSWKGRNLQERKFLVSMKSSIVIKEKSVFSLN